MRINLANQLTLTRLVLALVLFALLSWFDARHLDTQRWLLHVCFWIFLVAVLTDILDGLVARLTRTVTTFGRIVDPVVDKVIICGVFILFASHSFWDGTRNITDVAPWMVVVILTRELLVSAVRAHAESGGVEFAATWSGKFKMFVQSATIAIILGQLAWNLEGLSPLRTAAVWLTVAITLFSAITYVHRARAFLLTGAALSGEQRGSEPGEPS
ncbi:MAG: CDP-alcohol phosphatidyltransferase family protein [Phycisphaerales bacterium]|nr:CDP-alcohol phosphatidyltransferase family protein [Phycisphaerales bacterium]